MKIFSIIFQARVANLRKWEIMVLLYERTSPGVFIHTLATDDFSLEILINQCVY